MEPIFILLVTLTRSFIHAQDGDMFSNQTMKEVSRIACGQGEQQGTHICVPYYACDRKTRTIIRGDSRNGFDRIDLSPENNSCEHYLDVCCEIPDPSKLPPNTTDSPATEEPIHRPSWDHCGIRNPDGIDFKLIGNRGDEVEYGEFPWMVALLWKDPSENQSQSFCSGSLIKPNVVLTAKHCITTALEAIKVRAGEWDTQTRKERFPYQERDVYKVLFHLFFGPRTFANDLALLILDKPFDPADNIGTICLPKNNEVIDSTNCFVSSWEKNSFGKEGKNQVILKKLDLWTIQHDLCQEIMRSSGWENDFTLDQTLFCTGAVLGEDTFTVDDGSPLVCSDPNHPGRYVQAGIVSWGVGFKKDKFHGVYTNVAKFRNKIDIVLCENSIDPEVHTNFALWVRNS